VGIRNDFGEARGVSGEAGLKYGMNGQAKVISIGDLFRQSRGLYRERISTLTKIMLLPIAFLAAGDLFGLLNILSRLGVLLSFIGVITSFMAALALIFALQNNVQSGESYRLMLRRFWPYGWLTVLSGFVTLGGFVMLVIPGIIFSIWFIFAIYVFALEGEKGMNALLRSREYVRSYWWKIFGRQVVLILSAVAVILAFGFLGAALTGGNKSGTNLVIDLLTLVTTPFITAYFYVLYQNLKSLKPEVMSQPASGPRGFFYFSAVLGVLGLVALIVVLFIIAALLISGAQ